MSERIKLVSIPLDELPEKLRELLRTRNLPGEVRLVPSTTTIEFFAIVEQPPTPNATTIAAIEEAERGEMVGPFHTVEELLADLNAPGD